MEKTDVIVVLGHRLLPDDTPSDDLKRRIDKAVEVWRETGAPMIMPCGGLTRDRHRTEAEVMKEMLIERGVPGEIICLEDKSRITLENMVNACDLVGTQKRVAIVSSDYHMDMAMKDAEAVGLNAYGVGAETPDAAYREQNRTMLNGFEEKLDTLCPTARSSTSAWKTWGQCSAEERRKRKGSPLERCCACRKRCGTNTRSGSGTHPQPERIISCG